MIKKGQFYLTTRREIGYILHEPMHGHFIMRLDNDRIVEFTINTALDPDVYVSGEVDAFRLLNNYIPRNSKTQLNNAKVIELFLEPLSVEVRNSSNTLKLYFSKINKTLDFDEMCRAYVDKHNVLICNAAPYECSYQIIIYAGPEYPRQIQKDENFIDRVSKLIFWLPENFEVVDYAIAKAYGYSDDIYDNSAQQIGYSIWFKDASHYNLTKLKWNNIITKSIDHNN